MSTGKPLFVVFYAWQSDTNEKCNRYFILDCAREAAKKASADPDCPYCFSIDHDTRDVPGLCDIPATIIQKIDACDAFLVDLTFVAKTDRREAPKYCPNPNVLFELGYAFREVGWKRIICVANESHGHVSEQIFDLAHRRHPLHYTLSDASTEKKAAKEQLIAGLKAAFLGAAVLGVRSKPATVVELQWKLRLAHVLIGILTAKREYNERRTWTDLLRVSIDSWANELRSLAASGELSDEALKAVPRMADQCDDIFNELKAPTNSTKRIVEPQIAALANDASQLKARIVDRILFPTDWETEYRETLGRVSREAKSLAGRLEKTLLTRSADVQHEAQTIGASLLQIVDLPLSFLEAQKRDSLRSVASQLHLIDTLNLQIIDGGATLNRMARIIRESSAALEELIS